MAFGKNKDRGRARPDSKPKKTEIPKRKSHTHTPASLFSSHPLPSSQHMDSVAIYPPKLILELHDLPAVEGTMAITLSNHYTHKTFRLQMDYWKRLMIQHDGMAGLEYSAYPLLDEFTLHDYYLSIYGITATEWDATVKQMFHPRKAPAHMGFYSMGTKCIKMLKDDAGLRDVDRDMLFPRVTTDSKGWDAIKIRSGQMVRQADKTTGGAAIFDVDGTNYDRIIPAYLLVPFLRSIVPPKYSHLRPINARIIDHYASWYEQYKQTANQCLGFYDYIEHEMQHIEAANATARQCTMNIAIFRRISDPELWPKEDDNSDDDDDDENNKEHHPSSYYINNNNNDNWCASPSADVIIIADNGEEIYDRDFIF